MPLKLSVALKGDKDGFVWFSSRIANVPIVMIAWMMDLPLSFLMPRIVVRAEEHASAHSISWSLSNSSMKRTTGSSHREMG